MLHINKKDTKKTSLSEQRRKIAGCTLKRCSPMTFLGKAPS